MKVSGKTVCALTIGIFLCATGLSFGQSESLPSSRNPSVSTQTAPPPQKPPQAAPETPTPLAGQVSPPAAASRPPDALGPNITSSKGEAQKRYIIGPLDVLLIKVWNQQQLSGAFDVGPDGMVSMSLIGEVKADGLTTTQLRDVIQARLKDCCLNDPIVEVAIGKINSKRVFVYGEALRPGPYPLIEKTTIMDVLSEVGFKEFANPKKITVQRGDQTFRFNYEDFRKGKNKREERKH